MSQYSSDSVVILNKKETGIPTRDGRELNVMVQGNHERTMVFLHGWGENHNFFTHQVNEFSGEYRIVSLDQRGHGLSYKLKPPEHLSLQILVEDVCDVMRYLHVKGMVVMGHSLGSAVAMKFAIEHPEITNGVITTGGLAVLEPEPWKTTEVMINAYDIHGDKEIRRALAEYDPEWDFNHVFTIRPENKAMIDRFLQVTKENDVYSYVEAGRALNNIGIINELDKIKCPVLLLAGDSDIWAPIAHTVKLSKGIRNSTLKIFSQVSHGPHIEQPKLANQLISNFLKTLDW